MCAPPGICQGQRTIRGSSQSCVGQASSSGPHLIFGPGWLQTHNSLPLEFWGCRHVPPCPVFFIQCLCGVFCSVGKHVPSCGLTMKQDRAWPLPLCCTGVCVQDSYPGSPHVQNKHPKSYFLSVASVSTVHRHLLPCLPALSLRRSQEPVNRLLP